MRIVLGLVALALAIAGCAPSSAVDNPPTTDAAPRTLSLLALGDSYTEGTSIDAVDAWPAQLARSIEAQGSTVELTSIAGAGWNTTRLHRELEQSRVRIFDEIVLAIGTNDVVLPFGEANFVAGLDLIGDEIERRSDPSTEITIMSIPDFRATPWGQERLDRNYDVEGYNEILQGFAEDLGARYVDVTAVSGLAVDDPDLVAADGLHFSARMYALWVGILIDAGVGS